MKKYKLKNKFFICDQGHICKIIKVGTLRLLKNISLLDSKWYVRIHKVQIMTGSNVGIITNCGVYQRHHKFHPKLHKFYDDLILAVLDLK